MLLEEVVAQVASSSGGNAASGGSSIGGDGVNTANGTNAVFATGSGGGGRICR